MVSEQNANRPEQKRMEKKRMKKTYTTDALIIIDHRYKLGFFKFMKGQKMSNELTVTEEKTYRELEMASVRTMLKAVKRNGKLHPTDKAALQCLSICVKKSQIDTARESLKFNMALYISNSKDLDKFIKAANPRLTAAKKR